MSEANLFSVILHCSRILDKRRSQVTRHCWLPPPMGADSIRLSAARTAAFLSLTRAENFLQGGSPCWCSKRVRFVADLSVGYVDIEPGWNRVEQHMAHHISGRPLLHHLTCILTERVENTAELCNLLWLGPCCALTLVGSSASQSHSLAHSLLVGCVRELEEYN